jgi:hypothetical protein
MTDTTPRSGMPLLAAAQAQKHVTHNEALVQLDALLYARILDRDLTAPPSTPADGDAYLVKATATGAWTGQSGKLAAALDGAWRFYAPFTGLSLYVVDESKLIVFDGSTWRDYAAILDLQNVPLLGVNATADTTNKLAVKSAALLFDNIGGGIQAKLNKHAAGDTASLLYQTNYSGRAEFGLCGDDNLHLKVSPDGASWTDAVVIDKTTGRLGLGIATPLAPLHIGYQNTPWGGPSTTALTAAAISAISGDGSTQRFITLAVCGNTPNFTGVRFNGSITSPTACAANDGLANLSCSAFDGTALAAAANFIFLADEAFTSTAHGTRFELQLTPDGTTSRAAKLIVYGDGRAAHLGAVLDQSCSRQVPTTGFSITIADACGRLILDPAGTLAAGTIVMPASPKDGQLCVIASSTAVTALTHSPNTGQSLKGALTALAANTAAAFTYVVASTTWYRTA